MHTLHIFQALGSADQKGISRDPLMRVMLVVPFGLAAATRWVLPAAAQAASAQLGYDISGIAQLVAGYILLILPPMICGMLVGFLLLDQRDEQSLLALRVTPLPLAAYLAYRLSMPFVLGIVSSTAALRIAGIVPAHPLELLLITCAAAPIAPLTALFLGVCATNKVQGLALQKLLGIPLILPVLAIILPQPWDVAAIIAPTLWPASMLWQLQVGGEFNWLAFFLGLSYQGILIIWLLRKLRIAGVT